MARIIDYSFLFQGLAGKSKTNLIGSFRLSQLNSPTILYNRIINRQEESKMNLGSSLSHARKKCGLSQEGLSDIGLRLDIFSPMPMSSRFFLPLSHLSYQ